MKKYWKLLLMAAGIGIFTACEDVPEPYNIPTEGNTPSLPTADYIINQTFTSSLGDFKSQATSGSLAWTSDTRYGAIISGYQDFDGDGNKENKPGETYLISPEIDLTEADSAYVIRPSTTPSQPWQRITTCSFVWVKVTGRSFL